MYHLVQYTNKSSHLHSNITHENDSYKYEQVLKDNIIQMKPNLILDSSKHGTRGYNDVYNTEDE